MIYNLRRLIYCYMEKSNQYIRVYPVSFKDALQAYMD